MNTINFNEAFDAAEATNAYDKLVTVLNMTVKAVKAERDRLMKDDLAHANFAQAVQNVTSLNDRMREDPMLIDDYLAAAKAMQAANNVRNARGDKSAPQWDTIDQCFSEAGYLMVDITPEEPALAQAA